MTDLARTLELLDRLRLLRPTPEAEPSLTFQHSLVQQAAYESVLKEGRRRLHLAVGEALLALGSHRIHETAEVLAGHFLLGEDASRGLHFAEIAGDQALSRFATREAAAHFATALDLALRLEVADSQLIRLMASRGRALELSGDHQGALALYDDTAKEAERRGSRLLALSARLRAATLHAVPTSVYDPSRARQLAEQALIDARELEDPAAEARAHWILMTANLAVDPPLSVQHGETAVALARRHGLREQLAFTLNDIQQAYSNNGQRDRSKASLEEARPLWVALDNLPMLADNLSSAAIQQALSGDLEGALDYAAQALETSRRIGNFWGQSYAQMARGMILLLRGDIGPAIDTLTDCIALGDQAGFMVAQVSMRCYLAMAYGEAGDLDRARATAEDAERVRAERSLESHLDIPAVRAWIEARSGQISDAVARMETIQGKDLRGQLVEDPALVLAAEMEVWLASGQLELLLERAAYYEGFFRRYSIDGLTPILEIARGRALEALGRHDDATAAYRRGLPAQDDSAPPGAWQAEAGLARLSLSAGEIDASDAFGARAARRLRRLALDLEAPGLAEAFLRRPEVNEVLSRYTSEST